MTEQKQIEEMVNVMIASNNPFVDVPIEIMPKVAKALYNAGYQKLPKDSVVLTKEEYIDLSRNYVKEQKAQAVKEFAEKVKEKYGHYWCYLWKKDLKQLRTIIDELLKEYEK